MFWSSLAGSDSESDLCMPYERRSSCVPLCDGGAGLRSICTRNRLIVAPRLGFAPQAATVGQEA